ncbi:hypothetical protein MtrunA17_Chr2g0277201 [Medicago truncatula]|uniref:WEB family plant protein n=1 Tax=Medicago truncatula TaxID=3880 RepID=G7INA0_MEDTR|nr:WEB family protein At1g75720 [Medicago truncatula]AES63186.1 hypothetical protein MTR_2g005910 [Medicago truncatula]RHN71470.1 hypothetical protein MtrunA17_Chr2g0277201 [Medicago truncatula]
MEHEPMSVTPTADYSSTVDTSRPFSSVKEAVAIFGERLLVGEIYSPSPKPFSFSDTSSTAPYYSPSVTIKREPSWRSMPSSPSPISPIKPPFKEEEENNIFDTIKKLEAELEKTKTELKMLKERGSETEVALATMNAELHKNMSKLAQAEAAAAGKAAAKTVRFENISDGSEKMMRNSQTLAHIISLGENDHIFGGGKKRHNNKSTKQKPIIPLLSDFFFKRKNSTNHHNNPLYASPF